MVHPVHHYGLVRPHPELTQIFHIPDFTFERVELEGKPQRTREVPESLTGRLQQIRGGSEPGDPHGSDLLVSGGEDVEQSGPLEALHYIEIDDVDVFFAVQCLENGLVGCEV
ncbi:hypothetical protein F2P56_001234 [Juglans regia]|uniref:Uncharacterized protein n=1 Tax=Juglans regia TaxID=51240 RepID=A0A833Y6S4_JUGRE|nr:hypothetical protein F2P56_001234 [Juglans regia]